MGLGTYGGGLGVARWLLRRGARLTVTDLRDQHALTVPIADLERSYLKEAARQGKRNVHRPVYVFGRHRRDDFTRADLVVRNPAVPTESPYLAAASEAGVPVETDISLFLLLCPFPVTGITGTKGKSTVTMLLGEIATRHDRRTVIGGNIRISPFDALDRLLRIASRRGADVPPVVLELSSWQLEGLAGHRRSPHIGVVTNLMQDHLNRYSGMPAYIRAKSHIIAHQGKGDVAILNAEDPRTVALARHGAWKGFRGKRVWFSSRGLRGKDCVGIRSGKIVVREDGKERTVMPVSGIKVQGKHNVMNALAATAAAHAMGIPARTIAAAIRSFRGVPGRLDEVATKGGVRYINDTTATAPDASIAALRTVGGKRKRVILITGGADKDLDFREWAKTVVRTAKHVILFEGSATPKIERALRSQERGVAMSGARSMSAAIDEARRHAKAGDIVLLSPGCASFGLFRNEFDRGDRFVKAVRKLKG